MSNLAVDVLLGDEKRAGETIYNALTGRPVSATSIVDAAVTLGSDALMFVPGLGAAAAAVKAGRVAKTATRGAKAYEKVAKAKDAVKDAKAAQKSLKWLSAEDRAYLESTKAGRATLKATEKAAAKAAPAMRKVQKLSQAAKKKTARFAESTPTQLRKVASQAKEARVAYKAKRKSPRRRKMRHYGAAASFTKDLYDYARYKDTEE